MKLSLLRQEKFTVTKIKKNHRTITERIKRARTKERLLELTAEWVDKWETEQVELIRRLGNAIANDDYDEECICTGQLRAITEKRFTGLRNSVKELIRRIDEKTDAGRSQERSPCGENDPEKGC